MKCPAGHELPRETKNGQCTPLYCADDGATAEGVLPSGKAKRAKKEKMPFTSLEKAPTRVEDLPIPKAEKVATHALVTAADNAIKETVEAALENEVDRFNATSAAIEASKGMIGRAGTGLGAFAIRQAFLKIPKAMDNEKAEEWAQSKAVELLPTALGEVEFRLKFGTDDQRYEAAKDVLDMNGMRKRDAINSGGNTIILNLGPNGTPWAKKVVSSAVDAALPEGEKK